MVLCVYNGGLDVGVCQEAVYELFKEYGEITEIIMIPQKAYCFVCYQNEKDSERACDALTGHNMKADGQDCKLNIFYVSQVPPSIGPTSTIPPGLILLKDFISEEKEDQLLKYIEWQEGTDQDFKLRKVKHYGYEFDYAVNIVDPNKPLAQGIPDICHDFLHKAKDMSVIKYIPDQLTISQYPPGQGMLSHVDTVGDFEDGIMLLSLGSQVLMEFHHPKGEHLSLVLPPRSLLVMTGESTYRWSHGITPQKTDIINSADGQFKVAKRGIQTSFTFRKLAINKGSLENNASSDHDGKERICLPNTEEEAISLEQQHVHQVYEEIADHFSSTRHSPWPQIVDFLKEQPLGSIMADIGCGNGKYLGINKTIYSIGSDRSFGLVKICQERCFEALVSDVMSIPLRCNICDVCICIAVIHHLSTKERRFGAVRELLRILRPGGKVLIYVWALEQERHKVKSKYLKQQKKLNSVNSDKVSENKESPQNVILENVPGADESSLTKTVSTVESNPTSKTLQECSELSLEDGNQNDRTGKNNINIHVNRTEFKDQDMFVPWQLKNNDKKQKDANNEVPPTYHRFYHVFKQGELEELCTLAGNCDIVKSYYDQGNWCVILQKIS
ncbi:alkylated DNA repair protein alkB homolog 8 isoform X2 [Patella vulgata]|uniref:alkylated DNA repair protein alkB homolog 8 isoform X2 n=1 Tax=Patella vulgata TaxID=6465 RepID=UPI00217FA7B7|nr:alkylated DNA repair protein alkB homolog 8 isoform X2 [Patella vulgata]